MPRKGERWTPQERIFVNNMAMTGDKTYAATRAGYKHPDVKGHAVMARPAIQAEVAKIQQEKLFNEVLPLAVKVHTEILMDPKAPAGARVQAVKLAYDRTLGLSEAMGGKEAHEMTAEEIAKAIDELKRLAADKARPVIDGELSSIDEEGPQDDIFG